VNESAFGKIEVVLPRDEAARAFLAVEKAAQKVGRAADSVEACTQKLTTELSPRDLYVKGVADGAILGSVAWIGVILTWLVLGRFLHR
jgi:hypothetical protein